MGWKNYILPPAFHAKASEVHRAVARVFGLSPAWLPRNYDTFAKEGYNANVWVNRCIKAVAENAAGVPWLLYQIDSKGERKEILQHDLLKLLDKPNEFTSRQEFIEALIAFMLISGNSYMDMVGPNDTAPPKELWTLRPDRMKVIPHPTNYIGGYVYELSSEKIKFGVNRIAHLKFFNPLDDYYGLAPIEVAARGIDNDNAANAWNNSLLTNGARPTGALVTKESLTDAQYTNVKAALDDHRGTKNAGKPLLLEGGLEWQNMSMSPRDMDFISSKKMSILEICAAFGVPPEIVGYGENKTYSNYAEARKALYEDAVLPNLNRVRDKLNATLVPKFGDNLYLDYNKDAIEALQENRDAVYKRATEAYKGELLTKDEAREEMGYGAAKEGGDAYYTPPTPAAKPATEPPTDEEQTKSAGFFLTVKALNIESDEQKNNFWQAMEKGRKAYYKRVSEKVAEQFEDERKKVLEAFKSGTDISKAINQKQWQVLLANIYVVVMDDFGGQLMDQFKKSANAPMETKAPIIPLETIFRVFDKAVQNFIATTVAKKVVGITDVTVTKLRGIIKEGEAVGESIEQIAERIDKLYLDQIIPNRSTVIARTEVIGASNAGNSFAAGQTGLKLRKEWLSTRDERTRDTHVDMDGEKVEKEKAYSNGLMFPGDPTGVAEEVIQCRCTEIYEVIKGAAKPLPKPGPATEPEPKPKPKPEPKPTQKPELSEVAKRLIAEQNVANKKRLSSQLNNGFGTEEENQPIKDLLQRFEDGEYDNTFTVIGYDEKGIAALEYEASEANIFFRIEEDTPKDIADLARASIAAAEPLAQLTEGAIVRVVKKGTPVFDHSSGIITMSHLQKHRDITTEDGSGFLDTLIHEIGHREHVKVMDEAEWKKFKKTINKHYKASGQKIKDMGLGDAKRGWEFVVNAKQWAQNGTKDDFFYEMFAEGTSVYLTGTAGEKAIMQNVFPEMVDYFDSYYAKKGVKPL